MSEGSLAMVRTSWRPTARGVWAAASEVGNRQEMAKSGARGCPPPRALSMAISSERGPTTRDAIAALGIRSAPRSS